MQYIKNIKRINWKRIFNAETQRTQRKFFNHRFVGARHAAVPCWTEQKASALCCQSEDGRRRSSSSSIISSHSKFVCNKSHRYTTFHNPQLSNYQITKSPNRRFHGTRKCLHYFSSLRSLPACAYPHADRRLCGNLFFPLLLLLAIAFTSAGCGGGSGSNIGSVGTLPPAITAGKATLQGTIIVPAGIDVGGAKIESSGSQRSFTPLTNEDNNTSIDKDELRRLPTAGTAAIAASFDKFLAYALVTVNKMKSNGSLEAISGLTALTDINGNFSIPLVPQGDNYILTASKKVTINNVPTTISLKNVVSIDEDDVKKGSKPKVKTDVSTTFAAEALKQVVAAINAGKPESEKVDAASIPKEKVEKLHTEIVTAIEKDVKQAAPAVDLLKAITGTPAAVAKELNDLAKTSVGQTINNVINNIVSTVTIRVKVNAQGGGTLEGASVLLTAEGKTYSKITDNKGECLFEDLTPEIPIDVTVIKAGYEIKKEHHNVSKHGHETKIHIQMRPIAIEINQPPVADAGRDQSVVVNTQVILDGSMSYDPDGSALTYIWLQASGAPTLQLSNSSTSKPAFTPTQPGTYIFQLVVNDGKLNSAPDTLTITVSLSNTPPIAYAGIDQTVLVNSTVTLNGAASSDLDGDTLKYQWKRISGPIVSISNPANSITTFIPTEEGTYEFELTVSDGKVNSLPDKVIVYVIDDSQTPNYPPVVDAGKDATALLGEIVTLDGSSSYDPDGAALAYNWLQISGPSITLSNSTAVKPTFTPTATGAYIFELVVSDGNLESAGAQVIVYVTAVGENKIPIANINAEQAAIVNSKVTLDGTASSDPDGDALTYHWLQLSGYAVALSSTTASKTTFIPAATGTYKFQLIVNDGKINSSPAVVTITVCSSACSSDAECSDNNPLTLDACQLPNTCQSACTHTAITCNTDMDCVSTEINSVVYRNQNSMADNEQGNTVDDELYVRRPLSSVVGYPFCVNGGTLTAMCVKCKTDSNCNDNNALTIDTCTNTGLANSACLHNNNPTITSTAITTATVGSAYSYDVDATDPDGDTLTYSLTSPTSPTSLTINSTTGLISWTPTAAGSYNTTVSVYDGKGGAATQSFTITVSSPPDTIPPTIIDNQTGDDTWYGTGMPVPYDVDFYDYSSVLAAAQYTVWSSTGLSLGTGTEIIPWTNIATAINAASYTTNWSVNFSSLQDGINYISVRVYDNVGAIQELPIVATDVFYIKKDTSDPSPPSAVYDGSVLGVDTEVSTSVTQLSGNWTAATDNESGILTYWIAIGTTPGGAETFNWTNAGNITATTVTGLNLTNGTTYYFSVKAVNGVGWPAASVNSNGQTVQISSNNNPTITTTAITTTIIGSLYSYDAEATDTDGDTLTYSLTTNPTGMTINSNSGLISWTPTTIGTNNVTVSVSDGKGGAATQSWTITVTNCDIVYTSDAAGNNDIWCMNSDGNVQKQLTTDTGSDVGPRWSPDGQTIIFVSNRSGRNEVYKMNPDGTNQTKITITTWNLDSTLSWFPDSQHFLFIRDNGSGDAIIEKSDLSGNVVTFTDPQAPKWNDISRDGTKVVYIWLPYAWHPYSELRLADGNGNYISTIVGNDGTGDLWPRFSPDGTRVAWNQGDSNVGIHTIKIDATNNIYLTPDDTTAIQPDYSPDGSKIIYISQSDGDYDIWTMNPDGSNKVKMLETTSNEQYPQWKPIPPENLTPIITTVPVTTATVGSAYSYDVNATDPDGDTLTYSLTSPTSPTNPTINSTTGLISWTPAAAGSYNITVSVSDGKGGTASQSWMITVTAPNQLPTTSITAVPATGTAPLTVQFTASCTDTDGTCVSGSWDFGDNSSITTDQFSLISSVSHTYSATGTYLAKFTATDNAGATSTVAQATITVSLAPTITGVITDSTTHLPIADAVVKVYATGYSDITLTNTNGEYAFYNVPSGTYFLIATKENYTLEAKTVTVP